MAPSASKSPSWKVTPGPGAGMVAPDSPAHAGAVVVTAAVVVVVATVVVGAVGAGGGGGFELEVVAAVAEVSSSPVNTITASTIANVSVIPSKNISTVVIRLLTAYLLLAASYERPTGCREHQSRCRLSG